MTKSGWSIYPAESIDPNKSGVVVDLSREVQNLWYFRTMDQAKRFVTEVDNGRNPLYANYLAYNGG